jgi:uncharacterized protein (TIGR02246 family)
MAELSREDVQRWIDDYVEAWSSNDPVEIAALFTDDATYRDRPYGPPTEGRDAIVADWLARQDEPGTWQAAITPLAVDPDAAIGIASGSVQYQGGPSFSNLWVLQLGVDGRCSSFAEWWIEHPQGGD